MVQSSKPAVTMEVLSVYYSSLASSSSNAKPAQLQIPQGPPSEHAVVEFNEISVETVVNALETLDGSKSGGPDHIYPLLLKSAAKALAPSLTQLFNRSLRSGSVSQAFKLVNVNPALKPNRDPSCASSYRGTPSRHY